MMEMRPWAESLTALQKLAEITEELTLVFVVGPGELAEEGLSQIGALIGERWHTVRHRLTTETADLAAVLSRVGKPEDAALLVHGLEDVDGQEEFERVARSLNLGRDALSPFNSLIVLWIPDDVLEEFRSLCGDLFHWRSLVATATAGELDQNVVARWRYLDTVIGSQSSYPERPQRLSSTLGVPIGEIMDFSDWARVTTRGSLAAPSAEWTNNLDHYVPKWLHQSREMVSEPIPVRVAYEISGQKTVVTGLFPVIKRMQERDRSLTEDVVERWAQRGDLRLSTLR